MYKLLQWKLAILAKLYLWKYKPMIIGVTGNAGKTSTKEMIGAVVSQVKKVRVAGGNLNNEIGLPLTILGSWDKEYYDRGSSLGFWFKVLIVSWWSLFIGQNYPEVLVLEYGADHPGDIKRLVVKYKPHISVVTTIGDVPVHIEYFSAKGGSASGGKNGADAVADEKANLIKVLSANDYAILNHDDQRVLDMKSKTKAQVLTYGFDQGATIRVSDIEYVSDNEGRPLGVTFKLNEEHHFAPVRIIGSLGKSQAWSSAAAAAIGSVLEMNLVQVSEALKTYHGPKGRLKILRGIKNSNIIDDTYNASPASTRLALETLKEIKKVSSDASVGARRAVAILGDMLELGEYSEKAHYDIGALASEIVDILVCVGSRAKVIASAFTKATADAGIASSKEVFIFDNSSDAKSKVQELIHAHDLILVKGSQGMRMEKIVEVIMAEPQQAKQLLVRQSKRWLNRRGS
ncbi:MAG: UDP-N-acetylmuramoyl-tripeptide--D-alanyl-D-alanine ligase [Patescibacteria group bacterium]